MSDILTDYYSSGANPGDLTGRTVDKMREALNDSLYAFAKVIFGYNDLIPSLHGDLADYIKLWGTDGYERIMTQIPREFFKTSLGTIANALWQICREPHLPVALIGANADIAQDWIRTIRTVIMGSPNFQAIYAHLLPPGIGRDDSRSLPRGWKWSDSQLDLEGRKLGERENSLSCYGVEGALEGHHWPKIIGDDWIGKRQKQSQTEMERVREFVRGHVYLMRPAERGMVYVNCTPWTFFDIYTDLIKDYEYKVYKRAALELPDGTPSTAGKSIFPQKLTTERLRKMYSRDPFDFNSQMMCMPMPGREQHFNSDWRRYGRVHWDEHEPYFQIRQDCYDPGVGRQHDDWSPPARVPLCDMRIAGILDPAPSEQREKNQDPHARNGLLVEGADPYDRRYILEATALRADYREIINLMFALAQRWGFDTWYVEEVVFSNVYRHWVLDDQKPGRPHHGQFMRVVPLKPGKQNKDTRITSKIPGWRGGFYYLNDGSCDHFEQEYLEYPNGQTKDLLDAMGYDHYIHRPESPAERHRAAYDDQRLPYPHSTRNPITGY